MPKSPSPKSTNATPSAFSPKRLENKEATDHFTQKALLPSASHYDVFAYEHALAFTVAGMMEQDLLQDTYQFMQQAIKDGVSFNDFKKQLKPQLIKKGWLAKDFADADGSLDKAAQKSYDKYLGRRLKTIYHTNKHSAYAAGQWRRIQNSKDALPYLQYMPSLSTHKRDNHKIYYGLIRPVDDPIWSKIYPPNGFGCKCWVKQLTQRQAEKTGISEPIELETDTVKNPHTGQMIETTKGVHFSFNHNFDRLTAMIRLGEEKHGVDFAKEMADKVMKMDTIAERYLDHWIGDKKTGYQELFTDDLAKAVAKHNLSESEFMALRHYTEHSVDIGYRELNALLNQTDVVDWERYLSLMSAQHMVNKALQKMPVFKGVVKRTLHLPQKALQRYQVGEVLDFRGLTSSSYGEKIDIVKNANVVLTITSKNGRLIEDISRFKNEKEVLFESFSRFRVEGSKKVNDTYYFELTQL